jgi:hypothetical protein
MYSCAPASDPEIEHEGPQLTVARDIRQIGDAVRRVGGRSLFEAERVRQAARGVDRDDHDPATGAGRGDAQGRGRGGLADAARAARDDQRRVGDRAREGIEIAHAPGSSSGSASASASVPRS